MSDETEFLKAYQAHQDDKQEARRLQGVVARLTEARAGEEAGLEDEAETLRAGHVVALAEADEYLRRELADVEERKTLVDEEIADVKTCLGTVRKRVAERAETLFSLLNDDLRQQ